MPSEVLSLMQQPAACRLLLQLVPQARQLHSVTELVHAAASEPPELVLLESQLAQPLAPLLRALRRHAPGVQVLVFGSAAPEACPPVRPWEELSERVRACLAGRDAASAAAGPTA